MTDGLSRRGFLAGAGAACAAVAAGPAAGRAIAAPSGEPTRQQAAADVEAFADEAMESVLDGEGATGGTVAVVRDGEVALTSGYGHAILDENEPITDESLFQLGSTVKVVTWTAAMQAADRGLVDVDTDVETYLDSLRLRGRYDGPVTLSHLATHTAGFEARVVGDTVRDLDHRRPLPESLADDRPPLVRPPGELPGYTNYAAGLAGQVVADAAGTTYAAYVSDHIFEPLGMTASTFDPAPDGLGAGPDDCYFDEFGWYSDIAPASGMSSTARDMAAFVRAHLSGGATDSGRILSPDATESMHEQWYTAHEAVDGMAFGFAERTRGETRYLTHTGAVPGFATDIVLVPEADLGLFVSVQGESPGAARTEFVDAFLDEYVPVADAGLEPGGRPERADDLVGTYRNVHGTDAATYNRLPMAAFFGEVEVSIADDGALVTDSGGTSQRWVEVAPLVFETPDGRDTLAFLEHGDGEQITHLVRDGGPIAFERVGPFGQFGIQARLGAVALAVGLLSLLGWGIAGAWRAFGSGESLPQDARQARLVAGSGLGAVLALPVALAAVVVLVSATGGPSIQSRPPDWFGAVLFLPVLGGAATAASAVFAGRAWYEGEWSLPARIHYTLVVAATAVLVWLCHYWRLAL